MLVASLHEPQTHEKGVLVRWRCMVQDTGMGNELCLATLTADGRRVCGLYGADTHYAHAVQEEAALEPANLGERAVLCCVSIPGETSWAHDLVVGPSVSLTQALGDLTVELSDLRRAPRAEHPSVTALVKIYDVDLAEHFKTTDVMDVIGLLDLSTLPNAQWHLDGTEVSDAPVLPCVHALHVRPAPPLFTPNAPLSGTLDHVRAALVQYIADALGGDKLAAEYLLLALVARVHARRSGVVVGPFSVNITGLSETHHAALVDACRQLVAAVVWQPLGLSELNDAAYPFYVRGTDTGIQAGRLQLPHGTCVVLDETRMDEGQLHDAGVRNIRALFSLFQQHTLPYVFPYSEMDIGTDLVMIVLSETKSLLPTTVHVHANPRHEPRIAAALPALQEWRLFIAQVRQRKLSIPSSVSDAIQDDFVRVRREGGARAFNQDDLQRCLITARLLALTHGLEHLSTDMWAKAKVLDETRAASVEQHAVEK